MTKLDKIEQAIKCAISLGNTFGGNIGGGKDIYAEALRLIAEMKADCVVVPRVATLDMRVAGRNAYINTQVQQKQDMSVLFGPVWNAMIQAAESEQKGEKI